MNEQSIFPVWFITGCSSGLGRALALRALARGHRVVVTAPGIPADRPVPCERFGSGVSSRR